MKKLVWQIGIVLILGGLIMGPTITAMAKSQDGSGGKGGGKGQQSSGCSSCC